MATLENSPKHDLGSLRIDEGQRKSRKTGKVLGVFAALIGVVVIVAGVVFAFRNQKPVVEVAVAQKAAAGRPALLNASGYVTPRRRATIAAKITGRVTRVNFDEGLHVPEGFVLATLDDSDARRALDSATVLGTLVAIIMGVGAVFGALNTMYSAVAERSREIATMRAIGFGAAPIVI